MLTVCGLDPALNTTTVAHGRTFTTISPGARRGVERMIYVRDTLVQLLADTGVDVVVMELPAFSTKSAMSKEIGGMWWVLRVALEEAFEDLHVVEITPTLLKRYATGRGNASKSDMLVAAVKRLSYDGADDNEADALWLCEIGLDLFNNGYKDWLPVVPETHRDALAKLR